jgi:hypothetical protein
MENEIMKIEREYLVTITSLKQSNNNNNNNNNNLFIYLDDGE